MQSFEQDLQDTLRPLLPLLPSEKATVLEDYIREAQKEEKPQISFEFLRELSQWVQLNSETEQFKSANLQAERYRIISLLAGSVTSPRSYFPPSEPKLERGKETFSQTTKEVTTLLNCVITIVGAGVAAWFASSKAGWRNEWRILFALLSAATVAAIELALYIAWTSGNEKKATRRRAIAKKRDPPSEKVPSSKENQQVDLAATLRKRNTNNLVDKKSK